MKLIVKVLVIMFCLISSTGAAADYRLYQYNGDLPFVEMMLGMMTAMGMIEEIPDYLKNNGHYNYSALSRRYGYQPGFNPPFMYQGQYPDSVNYSQNNNKFSQKCIEGNCERNKPLRLDGVWVTQYGEILGIKGRQFLWSDGKNHYLAGEFKRRANDFSLKVSQSGYVVNYEYRVDGNYMQTRDKGGIVRSFLRAPYNQ